MSGLIKSRMDDIRKSSSDSRNYRGLTLDNDLTVLLISDPDTDISAVSLSIAVGSLMDPNEIPGLAHFCEHMLFMGTKKYPAENEFLQFITQNGGSQLAYTALDHTNYSCSIKTDSLEPLMDRFSRFFFEPLFNSSTSEREINAINSEHEKNKTDDNWRFNQLKRSLADPTHPYNIFGTGTKQTLWDIPIKNNLPVCDKLLEFHSNWYSSNLMFLAVLGKEDLDILEDMVSSLFNNIERKDVSMLVWVDPIYKEEQSATATIVVPVKDIRRLCVNFLIEDQQPYYKSMPIEYVNILFNQTSLSAILLENEWCSGFVADSVFEARGIEFYEIDVDLTETGLNHIDDIIKVIFQYVNMLKLEGPQEWVHEENKNINAMEFQYKDKESPLNYVRGLTPKMIRYKLKDILTAEHLIEEWRPDLITKILSCFRPDNMRVTVISKTFQGQTNCEDKYYGTPYTLSKIPMETIMFWLEDYICEYLEMPSKNEYIAKNFSLVPIVNNEPEIPQIYHNSPILRCWLKKDTEFRLPKAYVWVEFFSPMVATDPFYINIIDIFIILFNESFSKHTRDANRAELKLTIKSKTYGFEIKLRGFNHKIHRLLKKTIDNLLKLIIDPQRLEIIKEEKIRELNNIDMDQPYNSAMRYSSVILSENKWSPSELLKSVDDIDVDSIQNFMNMFWSHLHIESLMYGNLNKRMAKILVQELENPFLNHIGFCPLMPEEMIKSREVKINDDQLRRIDCCCNHEEHCVTDGYEDNHRVYSRWRSTAIASSVEISLSSTAEFSSIFASLWALRFAAALVLWKISSVGSPPRIHECLQTFCVVSKRFRKNYIHRFTATQSFFMFSPWNSFRQLCIYISTNQIFDYVVMTTILLNCVFLAKTDSVEEAEYIFLAIYTAEMVIKTISKGFILNKYTYLRNPWNWLDFIVITSGYATIGMDVGNLAGLRTFRVLRALKTVSIMPGLKTIINALLHSFRQLAEVMTLTIFCLMVFALFALQVYMGELRNKCVMINEDNVNWLIWINKEQNWLSDNEGNPMLCGNVTGARHCPVGYVCLGVGPNPNHGYTNFDNFLWSMLTTFQLITLDYWENVYNIVLATCGPMSVIFFTVVVFFGSFYLINLMLAVVALSYEEEAEITQEERRKDLTDYRDESTFSFDPSRIPVKQLQDRQNREKKKVDGRKGVLLSSVTRKRKKSRRRRTPSQQRSQQPEQQQQQNTADDQDGTVDEVTDAAEPKVEIEASAAVVASEADASAVTVALGDCEDGEDSGSRSSTPRRKPSRSPDPPAQPVTPPPQPEPPPVTSAAAKPNVAADSLRPCALVAPQGRERWLLGSRQGSANTSEGNNRDSSLDDSGVVDDHDDGEATSQSQSHHTSPQPQQCGYHQLPQNSTNDNGLAVSKSIKVIKCNGLKTKPFGRNGEAEYVSQVVVIDDRNCSNCNRNCIDYQTWLRVQNCLHKVVRDPLFELFIMACIICNTIVLAIEHHGMSQNVRNILDVGNKVFTTIFTVECLFKLIALSNEFFNCGWNIFDMIIVTASLLDLSFEMIDGLSVLRCLRLLRVLKLAQSWTTMKVLLSIIISTIGALGNLTFVLIIIIYIFAVIGMQLFSKEYMPEKFDPDPVPRWNFSDFFHSFMMIFRILCGEWIEPLWDCMKAEEKEGFGICFAIFLPALVMGNFMVLNLFLALLLNSFNSEELKSKKEQGQQEVDEEMAHYRERWAHHVRVISNVCQKCRAQNSSRRSSISLSNIPKDTIVSLVDYEEVGDGSKLERSFQRIRSIIRKRKRRQSRTETTSCDTSLNFKLENTVKQLMRIKNEKKKLKTEMVNMSDDEICERQENCEYDIEITKDRIETDQNDGTSLVLNAGYLDQREKTDRRIQRAITEDSTDTGYNQGPFTTQQTSVFSCQESTSDDLLYHQIMQDAMCYAPTLTRDLELPMLDETFELSEHYTSPPPTGIHRRSYILATRQDSSKDEIDDQDETCFLKQKNKDIVIDEKSKKKPWITLVSYVDELTVGGRRDSQGNFVDAAPTFPGFGRNKQSKAPLECFPFNCYQRIGIKKEWVDTCFGDRWMTFRQKTLVVVDTPIFEWFILVLIFASSVTLCFEDIYLDENQTLKTALYWTNFTFCVIFTIELMLKWIALGVYKYFKSFWTALDFIIAMMSIFSLLIDENENLKVLRSLRTLRALRPLRAISRWQGMRIVVNALMYAIPSIFNVLLVCLVFWLIFSIMGVQFFGGKFFKCVDDNGDRVSVNIVNNRSDCMLHNYTWLNSKISFDNVGIAYLALFQVATFEGWMEVMADAVDARGVDLQPEYEANLYAYIYFVIFIVCGAFFTLNLFIGVIIDNFNMLKKKYEGGVLEMFLTESQKHYYTAMKKLGRKKPQKVIKRPVNQFMAIFYDLSNSRRFEIAIFVLIFLNMLTMGIEHYNQPVPVFFILEVCNAFFTTVFGLEALVKIIGLRFHYFTVPWNVFDFLLVLASVLGILMEDIMIDFPVSPTLLRVVRVFRIGRILRLIKAAKGIRKLLFALIVSLPALFNIGALLGLITFIYAIIGMSVFGHVKKQKAINDMVNFETFGRSMQLLFRLMTSAGWNDVLESLMVQPPDCELESPGLPNGNCGHPILAITYFTSFIIISYMIVINMYIAIILENFNQAHQEEEIGIVEDDLEMFYIRWSKYDPHATQFIAFNQISDFIASLDPPLGIPKPNIVALVSFNLPIARGNKIHCLDILHALVKHVLGHVDETDEFRKLRDQMDVKFKKQFPTRKELEIVSSTRLWKRQDKAARLIQRSYRNFRRRKKDINDLCSDTQSSSPGGWQSRLSSFLHVKGMSISGIGGGIGSSSRASSRKSSRASDTSDISELGASLWLNLPLFLLSNAQLDTTSKNEEQSPKKKSHVEGGGGGPVHITISEPSPEAKPNAVLPLSLDGVGDLATGSGTADRKQQQHQLPQQQQQQQQQAAANVSITITDASPVSPKPLSVANVQQQQQQQTGGGGPMAAHSKRLAFRRASEAKIVQHKALVHRTSEGPHS